MNQDIYVVIEHLRGHVADISYMMLAAARILSKGSGGKVVAVLLGYDAEGLARDLNADRVLYLEHPALADFAPDAYQKTLADLIKNNQPRVVLFGHTTVGMDVAGGLSAQLNLPVISQCRQFQANGLLKFISQICGGKIMAEGDLPDNTTLMTLAPGSFNPEQGHSVTPPKVTALAPPPLDDLRVKLVQYIEPETDDVDISGTPVLVAVGRGLQNEDDLELVQELAEALGGAVCASRPVVDQGWLSSTRLVGKSGYSVKPRLYLALGISGAPEHVESITGSEMIVAVNTDPAAPIFDVAQYGAEVDMLDLVEVLTEKIEEM